ncbi:class I SAM-dependent methyltransferase [Acidiphilium sp.]|uniref:class I SAM-dependent methyltransferase n=1 Tax=Acidiphilium sp. TaxID=527 RepID=UPI003D03E4BA
MTDNSRQIAYWNEVAGPKWVRIRAQMEARLTGAEDLLMARAAPGAGEQVLEIGCGTGTTTAQLADAVGPTGHVTALDVSRPMLGIARIRLAGQRNITLIEDDAASRRFSPSFDLLTSRFGIMFFEDPVAAFVNLRGALRPGGRLVCLAWAAVDHNPHWAVPLRLAIERLGPPRPRRPHAPGPQAFADIPYVERILTESGFTSVSVRAEPITLMGHSLDEEAEIATIMGPAGALLDEVSADAATRAALRAAFRAALPGYADPNARMRATVHVITARP